MQDIIVEKPYRFIPPHRGNWWPAFIRTTQLFRRWLRKKQGVVDYQVRDQEKLQQSLREGHGILVTPNHCRTADPLVIGFLAHAVRCNVYAMASWHLFNQDWFTSWAIHKMGGFSVNREGVDRQSINTGVGILESAERPLVIFPAGAVSRTNDRLHAMLDGVAFIARTAAKKRARRCGGKVVIHPVALKYFFGGDLDQVADEVLSEIEQRFSWKPQRGLPLDDRVAKVGLALLGLKELEYFGESRTGALADRLDGLIDRLLGPIEEEWLGAPQSGGVVPRVKALRIQLLPEMIRGEVDEQERQRRWGQLADIYLAQQISCYPPDYLSFPSQDRYLETIERFEEDLTDKARVHGSLKVVIQVGDPIEVGTKRERAADGTDALMNSIQVSLERMLDDLGHESPLIASASDG